MSADRDALVVVSFKLRQGLADYLEHVAMKKGITKSELIRRALSYYLKYELDARPIVTRRLTIW